MDSLWLIIMDLLRWIIYWMGMDYNGFKRIIVDKSRLSGSINIQNWDLSMEDVASGNFTPFLLEIMLNSNSIGKITGTFPGFNCCVAVTTLWDGANFSTRRRVVDSGVLADRDIDAALAVISRHVSVLRSKSMCKVQQCPLKTLEIRNLLGYSHVFAQIGTIALPQNIQRWFSYMCSCKTSWNEAWKIIL